MSVAKVIYKSSANATPEVWMDVTQDTVESDKLLASYTATKNDGTSITGSYSAPSLQSKIVTPTTSTQSILPDSGFGGMSQVTVNAIPSAYLIPSGTLSITSNASGIDVGSYASVDVNVAGGGGDGYKIYINYISYDSWYTQSIVYDNVTYQMAYAKVDTTDIIPFTPGETAQLRLWEEDGLPGYIYVNGESVGTKSSKSRIYDYVLPAHDILIEFNRNSISVERKYSDEDAIIMRTISGSYANSRAANIGDGAFYSCSSLTSVSFQNCTTIGSSAFAYCSSLTSVSIPNCTTIGSSAFAYCSSLTSVSFQNCTTIGSNAFAYCSSLTAADFSVCTTIGNNAFYSCSSLTSVSIPNCTTLGNSAFYSCSSLTSVSFPNCTTIGNYAFERCFRLTNASFPVCTTIGSNAFTNCSSLTTIYAPSCELIGWSAFYSCSSLSSISLPVCKSIHSSAFNRCDKLLSIYLPSCITFSWSVFQYCYSLQAADIPIYSGMVPVAAFANCSALVSVNMPLASGVMSYAFSFCTALPSIRLDNCRTVSGYAFMDAQNLNKVLLQHSSTTNGTIAMQAFVRCYNLLSLYLLASTLYNLGNVTAFSSTPISDYTTSTGGVQGSIFVPASLYDTYRASTNWVTYADRFVSLTDAEIEALLAE